jgi:hypothetical protein
MAAKPLFARLQEPTRLATWVFSAVQGLDQFGPKLGTFCQQPEAPQKPIHPQPSGL